ncbi:MAG: hypothetical protein KA998_00140 [Rickettsiaceae bacterium]|nr:hypothetical protein [Rickettsiaceae bacterium]
MTKLIRIKMENSMFQKKDFVKREYRYLILCGALIGIAFCPDSALAAGEAFKVNLETGAKAFFDPLINLIENNWGKAVMLASGGSAIMGEGDLRQRGIRAGIGAGVAGATIVGLLAMFK